jgi:hypothetical protein
MNAIEARFMAAYRPFFWITLESHVARSMREAFSFYGIVRYLPTVRYCGDESVSKWKCVKKLLSKMKVSFKSSTEKRI